MFLLNSQSAALCMLNQTRFQHGKHSCHQGRSAHLHAQEPSARTAGMRRVPMYAAAISADVRFAATNGFVKTQTAFCVFQRASPVLPLNLLSAASCMQLSMSKRHGRRFCRLISSALGYAQGPNARTIGIRNLIKCVAKSSVDVRFAAIRPSNYAKTQTAFRVCQRASPAPLLHSLSVALCMRPQIRLPHTRRFCNAMKNAHSRAQNRSARTAGTQCVIQCVAECNKGVRIAAIKSFVNTTNVFRVCQRASRVLLLRLQSAGLCMRLSTSKRRDRHSYHRDKNDFGHVQSSNARTAGMRHVILCAAVINEGVRFASTGPKHSYTTRSNHGDALSNLVRCRGASIPKRDVRCRSTCLCSFENPIRILNTKC